MTDLILSSEDDSDRISVNPAAEEVAVGQWFWVLPDNDPSDPSPTSEEWLGCVTKIGSNFLEIHEPANRDHGTHYTRVHFAEFYTAIRFEPNAASVIQGKVAHYQKLSGDHLQEIKNITARLGINPVARIAAPNDGRSLSVLSGQNDVGNYKNALIKAKEQDLPTLFKSVKEANSQLARWLSAETLPFQAMVDGLNGTIEEIETRIFNVSLYAGLTEDLVKCSDGAPAGFSDKLHIMQRRAYMDEECLLNYSTGGMEFKNILDFDEWIAKPENRDRILPFPRCLVAMRVRRNDKEREVTGDLLSAYINLRLERQDKFTYLYIRNGEQLSRVSCEMDFDEMIFPDKAMFDSGEPMMVKMFGEKVDKMVTISEYEEMVREDALVPDDKRWYQSFRARDWAPFDSSNVHFDECTKLIADRIKYYNRVVLMVQGLFDRSEALHPHPPVKTWTPDGFAAAIELVYDGSATLANGPAPDFESYRARCNASMTASSVVVGQDLFWQKKEAEKESNRLDRDYRNKSNYRPKLFTPYGNKGPGMVAEMEKWQPKARNAVFSWVRTRLGYDRYDYEKNGGVRVTLTVPVNELFNISAYRPGDYRQFFQDSRTRSQYMKWAPMLLAAEEYHAGNKAAQKPSRE